MKEWTGQKCLRLLWRGIACQTSDRGQQYFVIHKYSISLSIRKPSKLAMRLPEIVESFKESASCRASVAGEDLLLLTQHMPQKGEIPSVHLLAIVERVASDDRTRGERIITAAVNLLTPAEGPF